MSNNPEQSKYQRMWNLPQYRVNSPGVRIAQEAIRLLRPEEDDTFIDFGCGTGRAGVMIHKITNCQVCLIDFTDNCLDELVKRDIEKSAGDIVFLQHDLEMPMMNPHKSLGFCSDVMEHIPEDKVSVVLKNILGLCKRALFQISLCEDGCGKHIGEVLHVTIKPYIWWLEQFKAIGASVIRSHNGKHFATFLVEPNNV